MIKANVRGNIVQTLFQERDMCETKLNREQIFAIKRMPQLSWREALNSALSWAKKFPNLNHTQAPNRTTLPNDWHRKVEMDF